MSSAHCGPIPHSSAARPQRQSVDALIAGWHGLLGALDSTRHLVGPIDVRLAGDAATAECHLRGYHVRHGAPGGTNGWWRGSGSFAAERAGQWRVTVMTLRTFYETGNRRVLEAGGS